MLKKGYSISNTIYLSDGKVQKGSISIKDSFIGGFDIAGDYEYKLDKSIVVPAFINMHDRLFDTYYPHSFNDNIKKNWVQNEKAKLDRKTICLLGAYKNFISGVLTVFDGSIYNDDFMSKDFINEIPIRVFTNNINNGIEKLGDSPCIIDKSSAEYLCTLITENNLTDNVAFVNGFDLSDADIENISKSKASMLWRPCSTQTSDVKKWLDSGINVALVSDSDTFIDEIALAQHHYKKMYGQELHEKILYNMITSNAARCLKLQTLGQIKYGSIADLLIIKENSKNLYKTVSNIRLTDIEAIIQNGLFVYANEKYSEMVYKCHEEVFTFNVLGEKRYCAYDIKGLIKKMRSILGYIKELPFLPID